MKTVRGRRDSNSLLLYHEEKKKLAETYTQQEVFWRQRSKQMWLREGDQNNKFFHAATKNRRKANNITSLQDDQGNKKEWGSGLENLMEDYFKNLFTTSNTDWTRVTRCISSRVTALQNEKPLAEVDESEVKNALFNMHPDKSPGPDGISPGFYQKCWKIVKNDVIAVVKHFFIKGTLINI